MWTNALNSEVVKLFVDLGNAVVTVTDKVGLLNTAFAALAAKTMFSNKSGIAQSINGGMSKFVSGFFSNETSNPLADAFKDTGDAAEEAVEQLSFFNDAQGAIGTASESAGAGVKMLADAQNNQAGAAGTAGTANVVNAGTETMVGTAAEAASWKVRLLTSALTFGISLIAGFVIEKAIKGLDNWIHRVENLREEVSNLTDEFQKAKNTFNKNLTTLTTPLDSDSYSDLVTEFDALREGVNEYGENISLTSEQYNRYKQICEKVVGIQPSIAEGYDSATEAMSQQAGVLGQLIELQKQEARYAAKKYTNDENMGKIAQDAINSYEKAKEKVSKYINYNGAEGIYGISNLLYKVFDWNNVGTKDFGDKNSYADDLAKKVLEAIGYTDQEISEKLKAYYSDKGYFEDSRWIRDYAGEIASNKEKIANAISQSAKEGDFEDQSESFRSWADIFKTAQKEVEVAQNELVNTFLQVPSSMEEYDKLDKQTQSFITKLIKNSDMFKIDDDTTQEEILKIRDKLKTFIRSISNGDYTAELSDGTKINAVNILDQMFSIDTSNISFDKYKEKIQELINLLWQSIGGENNTLGYDSVEDFGIAIGFEPIYDNTKETKFLDRIEELGIGARDEAQKKLNSLTPEQRRIVLDFDLSAVANGDYNGIDDVIGDALANSTSVVSSSIKSYSEIKESVEKFNEILQQTEDIVLDNTEVTQEYKDSLTALGISEDDLSSCFDENNKLVVTNVKRLKQLVNTAKTSISTQNILARAQARLKYKDLYKQLTALTKGQVVNDKATRAKVNTLYQEMSAIQKVISKYSLLEQQLADVTKTYSDFEEAQSIDSEHDYMSKTENMLVSAIRAYETGDLGTETAQISLKALVPNFELEGLNTAEEKAEKAHEYITETLNKYFVFDFDDNGAIQSAEMKMGNVRKFIEDGFENKVFNGADWQHFEWSDEFLAGLEDAPDKLQYFADKMKVTKEVALAVIQEINNKDIEWLNGDYGSLFDQIVPETLDSKLQTTTARLAELKVQLANGTITQEEYASAMGGLNVQLANGIITQEQYNSKIEELNTQLANGTITQEEYTRQVNGLNGVLSEQQKAANDACTSFMEINDKMDESQKKLEEYQKQLQSGTDNNGNKLTQEQIEEINKKYAQELQNYEGYLKQKKDLENKYGPMTEYTVSVALEQNGIDIENIDKELISVKSHIQEAFNSDNFKSVNESLENTYGVIAKINDNGDIEYSITDNTSDDQKKTLEELGALNSDGTVNIDCLYAGLTDEQKAEVDKLGSLQDKKNLIDYYLSMDGVDTVQTAIDNLATTLNNIYDLLKTSPVFSANVDQETKTTLDDLLSKVNSWVGEHWANFKARVASIFGGDDGESGDQESNGTAHINGVANASGNWGLKQSEHNSLVGELGTETVKSIAVLIYLIAEIS